MATEYSADNSAVPVAFDLSASYYGLHLGSGYVLSLSDGTDLDLYGKFLWNRQEGKGVRLSSGDPVVFSDVDSIRVRAGGRLSVELNDKVVPFFGLAYEHELDGKAAAATYGLPIAAPKLKGGTGIGEVGLALKTGGPVSLDLGVQGYVGKRQGASGTINLKIEF